MPDDPAPDPADAPSAEPTAGDEPAIDVHQPGYDPDEAPTPVPGQASPPDAVGEDDDRGGGPEQRAPEAPDVAT